MISRTEMWSFTVQAGLNDYADLQQLFHQLERHWSYNELQLCQHQSAYLSW